MAYIKDLTQIHSTNVPREGGGQLTTSCEFPEEPLADPPLESTDKTEADSISQKVTLFLTKSFELLVDSLWTVAQPLSTLDTPTLFQQRGSCVCGWLFQGQERNAVYA